MEEKDFLKFLREEAEKQENLQDFNPNKLGKLISSWERFKVFADLLNWSVRQKFNTLSVISALSATLLIVATFNQELIELNNIVRVLLSVLLLLIPASLWALIYELYEAERGAIKGMNKAVEEIGVKPKEPKKSFRGFIPWIINGVLTIVIILIIILIWNQK